MMEYWNIGKKEAKTRKHYCVILFTHHSIIPLFQYSILNL